MTPREQAEWEVGLRNKYGIYQAIAPDEGLDELLPAITTPNISLFPQSSYTMILMNPPSQVSTTNTETQSLEVRSAGLLDF